MEESLISLVIYDNIRCTVNHWDQIEFNYFMIVQALNDAAGDFRHRKYKKFTTVPGWNDVCRQKYQDARNSFIEWVSAGKVRQGPLHDRMKHLRKVFINAMKFAKKNKQKKEDNILLKKIREKNSKEFWKEVNKRKGINVCKTDCIEGMKEGHGIVKLFHDKFSSVTGKSNNADRREVFSPNLDFTDRISSACVRRAIGKLNEGVGFDGLHSKFFKCASPLMISVLSQFFTSCIIHNHIPAEMLKGVIVPSVKNKREDPSSINNYREVMISCNLFKIFEYCIMPYLNKVKLSANQFAYRKNTSTLLAISCLKETIMNNIDHQDAVYACFLDMSKAFERVNHSLLLDKLKDKGIPEFVINVFKSIFRDSEIQVCYNNCMSNSWNIGRGIRQGGVTSALLFNIYIDEILSKMKDLNIGCRMGISKVNVQAYADDLVLLSPTSSGLKKLIDYLSDLLDIHELEINTDKTKVVIFSKKNCAQPI